MYEFLRGRGVEETTLSKMKAEKIDVDVVQNLSQDDKTLQSFLCIGDRMALVQHCRKAKNSKRESAKNAQKRSCYERIRKKLKLASGNLSDSETDEEDEVSKAKKLRGNQNASKSTRKIEFGWVHNGTGVRKISGGGTRKTCVSKTANTNALLEEGKTLFFPKGISRKGVKASACRFDIRDFSHSPLSDDDTVGSLYEAVRMSGILRFFLYTTGPSVNKDETCTPEEDTEIPRCSSSLPPQDHSADPPAENACNTLAKRLRRKNATAGGGPKPCTASRPDHDESQLAEPVTFVSVDEDLLQPSSEVTVEVASYDFSDGDIMFGPRPSTGSNWSDTLPLVEEDGMDILSVSIADLERDGTFEASSPIRSPRSPTPPAASSGHLTITLNRVKVQQEMVSRFMDPNIVHTPVRFGFIDESGVDRDGVSREAYSCFWKEMCLSSMSGENERIPSLLNKYGEEEWSAVGRILAKGYIDQGFFPTQLAGAFAVALINGLEAVTPEILMDSFLAFIPESESVVVKKALAGDLTDEDDKEDLLDLLSRVDCNSIPSREELKPVLMKAAHRKIVQDSKFALDGMAATARELLQLYLPDASATVTMLNVKKPTTRKVLKLLHCTPMTNDEANSLAYLKQYIKSLDPSCLRKFLRYVTASEVMCVDKISVQFNKVRKGLSRAPIAHTCGPLLELPSTYCSYNELREEFTNLLESGFLKIDIL